MRAIVDSNTTRKEITTFYALWQYRQEGVTLAKTAQLAGMDVYDLMQVCKGNRFAIIEVNRAEQADELNGLMPA